MAQDLIAVMHAFGFADGYAVHGGDIGSGIGEQIALLDQDHVLGLHLADVPTWRLSALAHSELSPAERDFAERVRSWSESEGAYLALQSTRPQTLVYALSDSPAGLAAWYLEKFRAWSDCGGDVWSVFTPGQLATNATLYWVTETVGSAARYYFDGAHADRDPAWRTTVPVGVAQFPHDLVSAPREFAERWYDVRRWTEMPRGGHFAAWEQPELFADDLRAFVTDLT